MDARLLEALRLIVSWFSDLTLLEQFAYLFVFYSVLSLAYFLLRGIYQLVTGIERALFRQTGWIDVRDEYEQYVRRRSLYNNLIPITLVIVVISGYQYYSYQKIVWPAQARFIFQDLINSNANNDGPVTQVEIGDEFNGWVSRVIDGDTFHLRLPGLREFPVRLYGVDAPETNQHFGRESRRALSRIIAGEQVAVVAEDVDRDGRLVGKVYLAGESKTESEYVNLALVNAGQAWWYEQFAGDDDDLKAAQQLAKEQGIGLWANEEPTPHWFWRRNE